jgi:dihydrofolate reductase
MRRVTVFNQISVDGYFTDASGDMSWAHKSDPEWDAFVSGNAQGGGELLFGRKTYQMMESFWPTPAAFEAFPVVAEQMNALPKVVYSRTLDKATWKNTTLVKEDPAADVRKRRQSSGRDMLIMGSGTIVSLLTQHGLIDEYQFVIDPIALGGGRSLFEGMKSRLELERTSCRTFDNGNVVVSYRPRK